MPIYKKLMGNPFVDAGVCVLCQWMEMQPEDITVEDLKHAANELVPLMINQKFRMSLNVILPNSRFTNHSIKTGRKEKVMVLLNDFIKTIEDLGISGDCMGCGRRKSNQKLRKDRIPLTGSGGLLNFFPSFDIGASYCSACTFAVQFSSLSFVANGGKFLMISSHSWKAINSWTMKCIHDIQQKVSMGEEAGCYNPGFKNARNGLFFMTSEMVRFDEFNEEVSMQVFNFKSDNRIAELEIFYLPAPVFRFLRYANQVQFKSAWSSVVKSGYQKVNWDKVQSEEDYKNKHNKVYEYLLDERSIVRFFVDKKSRKNRGDWALISLYLKEVRNMQEERIAAIKKLADNIAESIRKSGSDKRLKQLEGAKYYWAFQNLLFLIMKDRLKHDEPEPLFAFDDYVNLIIPNYDDRISQWKEIRYLLLFRIYEQLHEWLKDKVEEKLTEDELDKDTN